MKYFVPRYAKLLDWLICQHNHLCQYYITLKLSLSIIITRIYLIFSFFFQLNTKSKLLLTGYSKVWDKIEYAM